jgi:hypothetical protein
MADEHRIVFAAYAVLGSDIAWEALRDGCASRGARYLKISKNSKEL